MSDDPMESRSFPIFHRLAKQKSGGMDLLMTDNGIGSEHGGTGTAFGTL